VDGSTELLPVAEQSPLGSVGVQEVGEVAELFPLLPVAPAEGVRVDGQARPLELDVTRQFTARTDRVVGAHSEVGNPELVMPGNLGLLVSVAYRLEQRLQRSADGGFRTASARELDLAGSSELRHGGKQPAV
jgi:hypothetical protein